jgi:hypothetical protein
MIDGWVVSPYVLSLHGLPLPPTHVFVTVIQARSYFASTVQIELSLWTIPGQPVGRISHKQDIQTSYERWSDTESVVLSAHEIIRRRTLSVGEKNDIKIYKGK